MPDFSQEHIKNQIAAYLGQQNRDPDLIKELTEEGFCRGFTTLTMYAKWLETQPVRKDEKDCPIPRDDFTWLEQALTVISTWDTITPLSSEEQDCFEQVLAKVNAYQNPHKIFSASQTDLNLFFSDTRDRVCNLEYNLVARFTSTELLECLPELLPSGRLIFVSAGKHSMGIFKNGDVISYIDPNNKLGMVEIPLANIPAEIHGEKIDEKLRMMFSVYLLPVLVFIGAGYDGNRPSPVEIKIFAIEDSHSPSSHLTYPSQVYFLERLSVLKQAYASPLDDYADNITELHAAIQNSSLEAVNFILKQTIAKDINYIEQKMTDGYTALMLAICKQDPDIIAALLKAGANPNQESNKGATPLNLTIFKGNIGIAAALITAGADVNYIDKVSHLSLLSIAALIIDSIPMIDFLLASNADINLVNCKGRTTLTYAVEANRIEIVDALIERGAIFTGSELKIAIDKNYPGLAEHLISLGVNARQALMLAIKEDDHNVIKFLIARGENPYQKDEEGETPLIFAAKCKQPGAFMTLLLPNKEPQGGWESWFYHAKKMGIDIFDFASSIVVAEIFDIMDEEEMAYQLPSLGIFSRSHEQKLAAADALCEALKDLDNSQKAESLKSHTKVLSSSLKHLNALYQAISQIYSESQREKSRCLIS